MAEQFKTTITAQHRLFDLHLVETLHYRDLILLFVKRDFIANYKQTILGPAWAIVQPLLTTVVFTLVFGRLAKLSTADIPGFYELPAFLFYMAGNISWGYFSSTLRKTSNTFIYNQWTMSKVYYPRLATPIATALSGLISFGIQLAMLLVFCAYYLVRGTTSLRLTPMLLLIPLVVLQLAMLAVGLGIIISAFTTKYRDLGMLVDFGVDLWRYACPIAYGLAQVPARFMQPYLLNPVTPIITAFRYALFGFGFFDLGAYALSWCVSVVVFFIGLVVFGHVERTFVDTI